MSKLVYGQNSNITNSDYHGDSIFWSSSALKLILDDETEFYKKYILKESKGDDFAPFAVGTYIHTMILEPQFLKTETAIFDGERRTSEFADFKSLNLGKTIITKEESQMAKEILKSYKKNKIAKDLIDRGRAEQTFCAKILNVPLKIRWDSIGKGYGVDVKTTSKPLTEKAISSAITSYGYALSAALYMEITRLCGVEIKDFYFMFANKKNYDIVVVKATQEMLEIGKLQMMEAIYKLKSFNLKQLDDLKMVEVIND